MVGELVMGVRDRMDSITDVPLLLASFRFCMNQSKNFHYPKSMRKSKRSKWIEVCYHRSLKVDINGL